MKTDLNLLLECLKYQMDNPFSQKEALVTIHSICQQNTAFGVVLSKYHIVSKLLALLPNESLDSGEKFSIILALGHCTENCEENQYDLFKNNGLPLMIQALTESQNEELNKAATFVLHNCKKITEKLSLSLGEYSFDGNEAEQLKDINVKEKNLEEHWKRAKEILHRIEQLEREGNEEKIPRGKHKNNISSMNINIQNTLKHLHADSIGGTQAEDINKSQSRQLQSYKSCGVMSKPFANDDQMKTVLKNTNPVNACYRESWQNKTLCKANSSCSQNLHEEMTFDKRNSISQSSDSVFKHPTHTVKNRKQQLPETGIHLGFEKTPFFFFQQVLICSTILITEKRRIRKNFTREEVNYLFYGVKKMGNHWNSILWSFPFQQGRTAVDLAHKYHNLIKRPMCTAP
ncbi:Telomere repeats-binding bouquet formation protein 1 [Sciurus carolinensis]|uniref:Telomere repeats-binding bouquet formation protein 1 n=1 Tax=Sciurus carolinensis TaxID=30640 RepID=A0AA41NIW2_SCICA|nr:Telomere repeats-binding bouquet formation protein 1 [Sciurus carolinensis]